MYDVIVIGGGVVGASIARELSRFDAKLLVIEKEADVSNGSSKANSAIVHGGYDPLPGTQMAKYNALGNPMFSQLCAELDVPFQRCGSLVLAFSAEEALFLEELLQRGMANGIPQLRIISGEEARELEPKLSPEVHAALLAETAGIVGPWELCIAQLENAIQNGADVQLSCEVYDIEQLEEGFRVVTESGDFYSRAIVNAAGVFADRIRNFVAEPKYRIHVRRGQYFVMDKGQAANIHRVIFQCPTKQGKGVLIAPTVHGNLLVGPDAEDLEERDNLATTAQQLAYVREQARRSVPDIEFREAIRNFAGLRAESDTMDFVIGEDEMVPLFFEAGGIKSPGLSAAPAIGQSLAQNIAQRLGLKESRDFDGRRRQKVFMSLPPEEQAKLIAADPSYGSIVCRCELITEAEVLDAIRRPLGATTVDGVKKRCRPGMGRCQGGFCGPRVQEILARELGIPLEEVILDRRDSYILTGETK